MSARPENPKQHTNSIAPFTSTSTAPPNTERKYTLPNRKTHVHHQLLNVLEPSIFAHNTLLPTQSLQRSNTLESMASASERWAADAAVRKVVPSQNLTEMGQDLIDGFVPQAFIRDQVEAVRHSVPRESKKVVEKAHHGGEADGVQVRDFAVAKQKLNVGEEGLRVAEDGATEEKRKER
ncbi:hypothetical protein CERZMDRAFT_96394 [Cercospora zeae-maydis SCOH1-5]|uniref:Uncharacterized protein n=1 Tax=Cercospora zeae-maydis SCOH1-5 TaxID=717836 RepID=A0A6A6FJI3_9PEZI|nr:hypothetical protein CERZMDRAFT_96394 [Cercospora zeae-maydis SCOH1-5]